MAQGKQSVHGMLKCLASRQAIAFKTSHQSEPIEGPAFASSTLIQSPRRVFASRLMEVVHRRGAVQSVKRMVMYNWMLRF